LALFYHKKQIRLSHHGFCGIKYNMSDEAGKNYLRKAKEALADKKDSYRKEMEAPIVYLNPEAHEDALKAAKEVWIESMRLLKGEDENVRRDSNDHALILQSKKKLENTIFEGADLGIDRYHFEYEGDVTHTQQEFYAFYLDRVIKTTRNHSDTEDGKRFVPGGAAIEKHEASRGELKDLLEVVRNSTQFKAPVNSK
jgi:hypothetical protein